MEKNEISIRYGTHYHAIKRIGNYSLSRNLQLTDLGEGEDKEKLKEMKAITQKCYSDKKNDKFGDDISVIDYLCIISLFHLVENLSVIDRNPEKMVRNIIKNYEINKEETNNLLRIVIKRPEFFFKVFKTKNIELYKELVGFWCNLYMRSFNH
jgi:hypothetical protein